MHPVIRVMSFLKIYPPDSGNALLTLDVRIKVCPQGSNQGLGIRIFPRVAGFRVADRNSQDAEEPCVKKRRKGALSERMASGKPQLAKDESQMTQTSRAVAGHCRELDWPQ